MSITLPTPVVLLPPDVWAGLRRHSSFVELQLDPKGLEAEVVRYLTPEAAQVLACQLMLAALAGGAYDDHKPVAPDRLSTILQRLLVELDAEMGAADE